MYFWINIIIKTNCNECNICLKFKILSLHNPVLNIFDKCDIVKCFYIIIFLSNTRFVICFCPALKKNMIGKQLLTYIIFWFFQICLHYLTLHLLGHHGIFGPEFDFLHRLDGLCQKLPFWPTAFVTCIVHLD